MSSIFGKMHLEVLERSVESASSGAIPDLRSEALLRAAMIGHTSAVEALLDQGVDANARDEYGRTPLIEAAFGGHTETVRVLLERGADVNARDKNGWTALMEAASKVHVGIVRTLLAEGADVNARSRNGWTALKTVSRKQPQLVRLLRKAGASV